MTIRIVQYGSTAAVVLFVSLWFAAGAWAQGGNTLATATPITPGQLETGNDALNAQGSSPWSEWPVYYSWWLLPVATGDQVLVSWQAQSTDAGLAIWQPDADVNTDHAVEGEGNGYVDPSTGVANEIAFTATEAGNMPFDISNEDDFQQPTPPGPYSFTVQVQPPGSPTTSPPPASTTPTSAPAPTTTACSTVHGSIGVRLLAALKCSAAETALEVDCGVHITLLVGLPDKLLDGLKTARGLYDLRKVPKRYRPVAKLINDIERAQFGADAPPGFRTGKQVIARLRQADTAAGLVKMLPALAQAVSASDYSRIALDIADLAGLHSCVQGLSLATG